MSPASRCTPGQCAQDQGRAEAGVPQLDGGLGTSVVEIVSTCSSGWKMTPHEANVWMEENMFAHYPLGDLKNTVKK